MHTPNVMSLGASRRGQARAVLVATAALLTGVLGSAPAYAAPAKVTLTYILHWNKAQAAPLAKAIGKYEKLHPNVTIELDEVTYADLLSDIETQGSSPSGPAIAGVYDLWLPTLVQHRYAAPAPRAYAANIKANYAKGVTSAATVGGTLYGYPQEVDVYALDYNKALFKQAGISGPPKNWDELLSDAAKLTKKSPSGSFIRQGFELINSWDSGVVHPWLSLVDSDGGAMISASHKALLTSSADEAVTNLYSQMVTKGYTSPPMGTMNANGLGPWLNSFTSQKSAMVIMANWWESDLQQAMGKNFANVGVAPIPVGPAGKASHSVFYEFLDIVNRDVPKAEQKAAWAFLKWVNGPTSGANGSSAMGDALMGFGAFPSRTSDLNAHKAQLSSPFESAYVKTIQSSVPFPVVLGGQQITDEVQKDIEAVEYKQLSPKAAMSAAQSQASALLNEYYGAS